MSRRPALLSRYGEVLRGTGAATALAASLIGRVALGTTGLALLLLVRGTSGSYATAGLVAAAYAASFAACSPLRARRADRSGPRGVVLACALLHPVALLAVVLLAHAGAGILPLVVAAVAGGATVPPLGSVMRALWGRLVDADALTTAYSLESVVVELCFLAGPLLVALLVAVSGPSAAVLAASGLVLVGGSWLAATPALRSVGPTAPTKGGDSSPLRSPVVRALLLTVGFVGVGFGALEVALPAFVEAHHGRPGTSGVLLAVWSAGSVVGGLVYGAVRPRSPHARQLPWLVGALAVGTALPLLASGPVVLGGLLVAYGLTIAPFSTCNSVLLGAAAPAGSVTEAFAWSSSLIFGGAAVGNAAAGALVEASGVTAVLLLTAGTGAAALASALSGRPARRPSPVVLAP